MPATTCFIIGPMGDAKQGDNSRLKKLARNILKPLLEEEEWDLKVRTPYDLDGFGLIMDNVVAAIDHADLVVADLTGNNPNVFYELSLCHSLGIPTIIVKEDDGKRVSFDIGAFAYIPILIDEPQNSISKLRPVIRSIRRQIANWILFSNPITNFYHAPVTNISPAAGLAQANYVNFVEPVGRSLGALTPDGSQHLYGLKIDGKEIEKTIDARKHIKINIIIPSVLRYTSDKYLTLAKAKMKEAEVQTDGRPRTMLSRWDIDLGCYQLYDTGPTIMNTMIQSIDRRANQLHVKRNSEEWKQLEEQEIGRFHLALKRWIDDNPSEFFKDRVSIIQVDVNGRNTKLNWLYDIWEL